MRNEDRELLDEIRARIEQDKPFVHDDEQIAALKRLLALAERWTETVGATEAWLDEAGCVWGTREGCANTISAPGNERRVLILPAKESHP